MEAIWTPALALDDLDAPFVSAFLADLETKRCVSYGSSALAIGEALISVAGDRHVILDPFQDRRLERSQIAWPRLAAEGMFADAAFVEGRSRVSQRMSTCITCR
jgi:hypothetical protein